MSYDIELLHPVTKELITFDTAHHVRGGTYRVGGDDRATLNVTWNYAKHFYRVLGDKGIRTIYGMTGAESMPILKAAADALGDDVSENYWEGTEGNAKTALLQLYAIASMRPDGVWDGD